MGRGRDHHHCVTDSQGSANEPSEPVQKKFISRVELDLVTAADFAAPRGRDAIDAISFQRRFRLN